VADADDVGALRGALVWAETLSAADLAVPRPWTSAAGAAPTLVSIGDRRALVTSWLLGTPVAEQGWHEDSARALGRLLSRAHAAAAGIASARTEGARRYDAAWAEGAWRRLEVGRALPGVDPGEVAIVQGGLAVARAVLAAAWEGGPGGPVVLAHADAHGQNALEIGRHEGRVALALIDLDRVGLLPVGLDLAFALLEHSDATTWALLRGYREIRELDDGFERAFAAYRLLAMVDNLAFLSAFGHEHAFIARAWPDLVASSAALNAGVTPPGLPGAPSGFRLA